MTAVETSTSWVYDDGGRAAAGWRATGVGDCVVRAIAIATELPYSTVYVELSARAKMAGSKTTPRNGVARDVYQPFLRDLGWHWQPTMEIGGGCHVHLCADELPAGRLVTRLSRHLVAVVDGVVHDTYDSTRDGRRCVYGYFREFIDEA